MALGLFIVVWQGYSGHMGTLGFRFQGVAVCGFKVFRAFGPNGPQGFRVEALGLSAFRMLIRVKGSGFEGF